MLAFDTHQYIKQLQSAGFTEEQAEIQANALKTIVENDLATKQDIAAIQRDISSLEAATKQDNITVHQTFKEVETSLKHTIEQSKAEILKWMCVLAAAQVALIVTSVKFI